MKLLKCAQNLQRELLREHALAPGMFNELARMESLLAETYRNRVQYELLQNSDDAGASLVEISVSNNRISWFNNGRELTEDDLVGICRSAASQKIRGESIGYRGIGLKSVASISDLVTVSSGNILIDFSKEQALQELAALPGNSPISNVPLMRIPLNIRSGDTYIDGVCFSLRLRRTDHPNISPSPLSLLFLRNIETVVITDEATASRTQMTVKREGDTVQLDTGRSKATFFVADGPNFQSRVLIPLNPEAEALCGPFGQFAAFLPLNDRPGISIIASADFLTDPSRTHIAIGDESNNDAIESIAWAFASVLSDPWSNSFEAAWQQVVNVGDCRAELLSTVESPESVFFRSVSEYFKLHPLPFRRIPISGPREDLQEIYQHPYPVAVSGQLNLATVASLKAMTGLEELPMRDIGRIVSASPHRYSVEFTAAVRSALESTRQHQSSGYADFVSSGFETTAPGGTRLSQSEDLGALAQCEVAPTKFSDTAKKWRIAELSVCAFLNEVGWSLEDVSKSNLGYDLVGTSPSGSPVMIEVKKVSSRSERFYVTNNEMALLRASGEEFLLAIVLNEGDSWQLGLLAPSRMDLDFVRVCRRWDWEATGWAAAAKWIS